MLSTHLTEPTPSAPLFAVLSLPKTQQVINNLGIWGRAGADIPKGFFQSQGQLPVRHPMQLCFLRQAARSSPSCPLETEEPGKGTGTAELGGTAFPAGSLIQGYSNIPVSLVPVCGIAKVQRGRMERRHSCGAQCSQSSSPEKGR